MESCELLEWRDESSGLQFQWRSNLLQAPKWFETGCPNLNLENMLPSFKCKNKQSSAPFGHYLFAKVTADEKNDEQLSKDPQRRTSPSHFFPCFACSEISSTYTHNHPCEGNEKNGKLKGEEQYQDDYKGWKERRGWGQREGWQRKWISNCTLKLGIKLL